MTADKRAPRVDARTGACTLIPVAARWIGATMLTVAVVGCTSQSGSQRGEPSSFVAPSESRTERGIVSHYGHAFAGRKTASGEVFDPDRMTMAHRTLPFGTRVRVTNLENQRSVELVVNDRGPFVAGRIADVSLGAARALAMVSDGVVDGTVEILPSGAH